MRDDRRQQYLVCLNTLTDEIQYERLQQHLVLPSRPLAKDRKAKVEQNDNFRGRCLLVEGERWSVEGTVRV